MHFDVKLTLKQLLGVFLLNSYIKLKFVIIRRENACPRYFD